MGSQRHSPEPLKQLSLKQSASDKPIYGLNDIPATEYASFQSPVLFYQQLGKVLEDAEQLKTGLLDLQKLGVSKQDSLQNTDDMAYTLKRRNTAPVESSVMLI